MNYLLNEGYDNNIKVSKGFKSKITINNKNYLDLSFCAGSLILGHNSKIFKDSLNKIIKNKISNFAVPNIYAEKMSELLNNTFPHYKKFIFCNSGSESVLKAIRISKAISKKDLIVSASGSWHGSIDQFLFSPDKNLSPVANCDGLSNFYKKNLKIIPYNDIEKSEKILNKIKSKISAIIIEPIQACLPMEDAVKYLKFLEKFSKENKIILIYDEMITGVRTYEGSVQKKFNLKPSISTFGKCIGGGAPIGVIGLSNEILNKLNKNKKKIYFGGTFSGNSISTFIGYNTLKYINQNKKIIIEMNRKANFIKTEINKFILENKIQAKVYSFESMLRIVFTKNKIINRYQRDFFEKKKLNNVLKFKKFVFENKIYYPSNGIIFVSSETTKKDCQQIIQIFKKGLVKFFKT